MKTQNDSARARVYDAFLPKHRRLVNGVHSELVLQKTGVTDQVQRARDELAGRGITPRLAEDQIPLTPALLPTQYVGFLRHACGSVFAAIDRIVRDVFRNDPDRIVAFFGSRGDESKEISLYRQSSRRADWAMFARPDFVMAGPKIAIVETNMIPFIGHYPGAEISRQVLSRIPSIAAILDSYGCYSIDSLDSLVRLLARVVPGLRSKRVAIVDWGEFFERSYVYLHMADGMSNRGVTTTACRAESLSVEEKGVFLDGVRIDVIYRFFDPPEDCTHEHLAQYDALLDAVYSKRVEVIGDLGQKLLLAKALLALVSDERLSEKTGPEAGAFVPWTRIVEDRWTMFRGRRVDLLPFLDANQHLFVLKASLESGGVGTVVGRDVSQGQWTNRLSESTASDQHWIAQEWIDSERVELAFLVDGELEFRRCNVDYGVFMFNRQFGGAVRRNTTSAAPRLTHVSQGAGASPVFFMP